MKETRVLITKMRLLLFLLVAVLAIGCQKDEISTASVVVTEEIHEDGDGHIGMDHISGDKIPKIMNLILPGVDIPAKTSDIATVFGRLNIEDILKMVDSLDNETYSFHIMPKIAKPNSVFNLVVQPPNLNSEQSISIVEYRMTEEFAEGYYSGSKTFEDFSGNVITYPYSSESDILQRDVCIQNIDEVVNCDLVVVNPSGGGATGDGIGGMNTTIGDTVVYFGIEGSSTSVGSGGGGSGLGHGYLSWVCSCDVSHASPSECTCTNTTDGAGGGGAQGSWYLDIIVPPLDSSHSAGGKAKTSCCDDSGSTPAGVNLLSGMMDEIRNCVPLTIGSFSFLANSPTTFGIHSYLDNNGCNSETKGIVQTIIDFGAANRSTPEGRQIADIIVADLLNNLNTGAELNVDEYLNLSARATKIGPTVYACPNPPCDSFTPSVDELWEFGPGLFRAGADAIANAYLRLFEYQYTDRIEGKFIRRIMLLEGFPVSSNISDKTIGEIFSLRRKGLQYTFVYDTTIGQDLLDTGIGLIDVISILSPNKGGGAFLAARGSGAITKAALKKYLATLAKGKWVTTNESMSDAAKTYQELISGRKWNESFEIGIVKYDGLRDGVLVEAKSGHLNFINPLTREFKTFFTGGSSLISQARRQLNAVDGYPVEWHFEHEILRDAVKHLFQDEGFTNLILKHTPR